MGEAADVSAGRERLFTALHQEAATRGYGNVDVEPHEFKPLKKWRNRGRCAICLVHEAHHPAVGWLPSRPWRDESDAIRV